MKSTAPVGKIEYGDGDEQTFYDAKAYIQAFRDALHELGITGVKVTTITRDPATHKAVDDLICNAVDTENPYDLDHYKKKYAEASGERTEQQPEPETDEELEL